MKISSLVIGVALEFLKSIQGEYASKDCRLAIELVKGAETGIVGHVLGVQVRRGEKNGAEFYVPLDFRESTDGSKSTRFKIRNGRRMFHYEYYDRNVDPGRTTHEIFLFEAVKTPDLSRLEYVEFGLLGENRRRINWMVCRF